MCKDPVCSNLCIPLRSKHTSILWTLHSSLCCLWWSPWLVWTMPTSSPMAVGSRMERTVWRAPLATLPWTACPTTIPSSSTRWVMLPFYHVTSFCLKSFRYHFTVFQDAQQKTYLELIKFIGLVPLIIFNTLSERYASPLWAAFCGRSVMITNNYIHP